MQEFQRSQPGTRVGNGQSPNAKGKKISFESFCLEPKHNIPSCRIYYESLRLSLRSSSPCMAHQDWNVREVDNNSNFQTWVSLSFDLLLSYWHWPRFKQSSLVSLHELAMNLCWFCVSLFAPNDRRSFALKGLWTEAILHLWGRSSTQDHSVRMASGL